MRHHRVPCRQGGLLRQACGLGVLALVLVLWSSAAAASDLHPVPHGEGRLWRVERAGAPPSHVMGTIHVTDPRVRDLPAPVRKAFEASEQAAFEVRMTPEEREAMAALFGPAEKSPSLAKLVDREIFAKLVARAARYGLPEEDVNQLHPFALIYLFSFSPKEHQRRAAGDLMFDEWLIQWAYDLGMQVEGLETLEEHFGFLDTVPATDHATMLRELVAQLEEQPDRFERLVEDYLDGDMTRVFQEMEAEMRNEPGMRTLYEALLDQRNRQMVERMIPLLKRGRLFVAVGAAHLPGEEGMLRLLERRGYRVTRVH